MGDAKPAIYTFHGTSPRPRATLIPRRSASLWHCGGSGRLPLGAWLDGRGTLDAVIVARQQRLPPPRTAARWALIVWKAARPGRDPYRPSWEYFFSPAEALDASESLESELVWSVVCVDVPAAPKVDSRALDWLVYQLRREAAERQREQPGRYDRWGAVRTRPL